MPRAIAAGPRSDLLAIATRIRSHMNPTLSAAGWRVYDGYLKANRVEHGTRSYGEVVKLVLGTHLGSRLTPAAWRVAPRHGSHRNERLSGVAGATSGARGSPS